MNKQSFSYKTLLKTKRHIRRVIKNEISKEFDILEKIRKETCQTRPEFNPPAIEDGVVNLNENSNITADLVVDNTLTNPVSPVDDYFDAPFDLGSTYPSSSVSSEGARAQNLTSTSIHESFFSKIRGWILKYTCLLSQKAINDLLSVLISEGYEFPRDCRTLLSTPLKCSTVSVSPGQYCHIGLATGLRKSLLKHIRDLEDQQIVNFSVNVDGLPLTRSSSSQFWPILVSLDDFDGKPFIAGIYHRLKKPDSSYQLLEQFIDEIQALAENGVLIANGKRVIPKVSKLICDAPAKAFVLCVKSHTGYSGCTKCIQEGTYIDGRVTFPELNSPLRTDNSCRERLDEEFHKSTSAFAEIDLGFVSQVPLDYMHLICLGVMKRLLMFWTKGKKSVRIPEVALLKINERLDSIKKCMPCDFARMPRDIREVDRYKATEFRQFVLYTCVN